MTENQNTYLLFAIARRTPSLASDWLATTEDASPGFTALVQPFYDAGGLTAVRFMAVVFTLIALWGVYLFARAVSPTRSRGVATLVMVLAGLSLAFEPIRTVVFGTPDTGAFSGVAQQYLVNSFAYLQPSTAGVLLLVAFSWWYTSLTRPDKWVKWRLVGAVVLASVTVMIHASTIVLVAIALFAALIADLAVRRNTVRAGARKTLAYVLVGIGILIAAVVATPNLVHMAAAKGQESVALTRFAFERIPHHTLPHLWPVSETIHLSVLVLLSMVLGWALLKARLWVAWVSIVAIVAVGGALFVEVTHNTSVALAFPWRISVIVVPLAFAVVMVSVLTPLRRLSFRYWQPLVVFVLLFAAAAGIQNNLALSQPKTKSDYATRVVVAASPQGLGLIPVKAFNVRLNAQIPVYADWKGVPYTGADLNKWWQRYDRAVAFQADPETFCEGAWGEEIDWIMMPREVPPPSCIPNWRTAPGSDLYAIYLRP